MGLGGVRALGLPGENLEGVHNAVDYIATLRQSPELKALPVGRAVVVIGGGNTAIDIAVQTRRLGAEDVTLVRSEEHTSELQSLMRISYAVFCLKKQKNNQSQRRH